MLHWKENVPRGFDASVIVFDNSLGQFHREAAMGKTFAFIGAGVLFLVGLCLLGYGVLNVIGSTA